MEHFLNYFLITAKTPAGIFRMVIERPSKKGKGDDDTVIVSGFGLKSKIPELKRHPYKSAVESYFKGNSHALREVKVRLDVTEFEMKVYEALRKIAPGKTATYRDVAKSIGKPNSSRAVGNACARNPVCLFIPCHRVVSSDGDIGNYIYGKKVKKALLEFESKT